MLRWALPLFCSLLVACAGAPPAPPSTQAGLLHDADFTRPARLIAAADLFKLSDAMRERVRSAPNATAGDFDPRTRLIEMLYRKQDLMLEYDASTTRTAAETYDARSGNCLSLVIMTAAFAKEMDLPIQYRSVAVEESWTRSGGLYFASGHVNLSLERPLPTGRFVRGLDGPVIVDFLPAAEVRGWRTRPIAEATVVAMFMNNRAAEAVARGALDEAYWYAREALQQDPGFLAAYNTLGVVYLRHGEPAWALPVFDAVLARDATNTKVMDNQVQALRGVGRGDEADRLAARLASLEPFPPYYFFKAGLAAMDRHDYRGARDLFDKEVARQAYNPEFHFWLAQANYGLGNVREAAKHLELARQNSVTPHDGAIYAAKLAWLRAHQAQ